jgi:hypothetical protein
LRKKAVDADTLYEMFEEKEWDRVEKRVEAI